LIAEIEVWDFKNIGSIDPVQLGPVIDLLRMRIGNGPVANSSRV